MLADFTERLARFVTERWRLMLALWITATVVLFATAPHWKDIAYDGDFEYLPERMTTVASARILDEAFPGDRARSQIVIVLGRKATPLDKNDLMVGDDLLRRLHHRFGEVCWQRAITLGYTGGAIEQAPEPAQRWLTRALESLDHCIAVDQRFYERFADSVPDLPPTLTQPRMAIAYFDRANLLRQIGGDDQQASNDDRDARILVPDIETLAIPIAQRDLTAWASLLDLLSWDDAVLGSLLTKPSARLAVMQLSSELAATENINTVESVGEILDQVRSYSLARIPEREGRAEHLELEMTGSAAIGGETLIASRDAIRYTESITVIMILLILTLVYRAPLLVAVPMVSIGVAVVVSTSMVATLTQWSIEGVVPWLDIRVFTTSRIFIVVILFGAGTDYCLFLISRLREEAALAEWPVACRRALRGVTSALLGSALTTVFGLGTLWFAQFGKYHYTGPIIAICLLVGLVVCLTLAPALLRALGPRVFWPNVVTPDETTTRSLLSVASDSDSKAARRSSGLWEWIAIVLTRRPLTAFLLGIVVLAVPGWYGWIHEDSVTYNLSSQLDTDAPSRRGYRLLSDHFKIGEINPVTILMVRPEDEPREILKKQLKSLSDLLYAQPGVVAVRTPNDPLGDFPPDREMGLLSSDAWKRRALQQHRVAQNYFFSNSTRFQDRLARLDVIIEGDPFALKTQTLVSQIGQTLNEIARDPNSDWAGSSVYLAGTTPSIIDLRTVTIADNQRIKIAVVLAVLLVLIAVIRRLGLCLYLIFTVLLSYYATLGLTVLFFRGIYADQYVGLDWKLPLFLFVILVAVGQDYNVYLVTRIVEEQRKSGWLSALRHAVSRTGGIITACGMVMAATFFSMTASAWMPGLLHLLGIESDAAIGLRGIIELGFALGLGVLIDTFYVRTILVPSFVALMGRWKPKPTKAIDR
ncbi:Putative membrane protein YdgH [Stieleria maiorica]|uniref:Membrane protein YdgH n=1 Tax=Stieleria maiorica TaxID=2795974 RepID=A0A5B9MC29_9BACT|nr:MMPL family transporter [Stieleria maiorica]QEF96767.1 Putative membrane protein YdgH [Stieleria maiorica]